MSPARYRVLLISKITLTFIGAVFGLTAFCILFWKYSNYNAAVWAFLSGIYSAATLHICVLQLKKKLHHWYSPGSLAAMEFFGVFNACGALVAAGVYISLGIVRKQDFTVSSFSYYPASVLSFIALIWAVLFAYTANHSVRIVEFLMLP